MTLKAKPTLFLLLRGEGSRVTDKLVLCAVRVSGPDQSTIRGQAVSARARRSFFERAIVVLSARSAHQFHVLTQILLNQPWRRRCLIRRADIGSPKLFRRVNPPQIRFAKNTRSVESRRAQIRNKNSDGQKDNYRRKHSCQNPLTHRTDNTTPVLGFRASSLIRLSSLVIRHSLRIFAFLAANPALNPQPSTRKNPHE
jgi:hypothetical protein